MRSIVLFIVIALIGGTSNAAEQAPDWRHSSGDERSIRLSQAVNDRPVVLFFWATWCPYCKALMPHLQSIRLEYGDDIDIFAIQIRDKKDAVAFIDAAGYEFTVFPQGDRIAELYEIHATPGVIVVDRDRLMQFDLRQLPQREHPAGEEDMKHGKKAAYRAPYWAAELRTAIDRVIDREN
jgi:thiol-disulfide isomerase/thioredoxin